MSWLRDRGLAYDRRRSRASGDPPPLPDGTETPMTKTSAGDVRTLVVPKPDAPRRAGNPTVVIVPDPPHGIEHVMPLVERLRADHQVLVFEAPGFGWSTAADDFDWSVPALARCFGDVLDAHDVRHAILVAPCIVGFPALRAAAHDPVRIRGVLLEQTPDWSGARAWLDRVDARGMLRRPVIGQWVVAAAERKIVHGWYRTAEPDEAQRVRYEGLADRRQDAGGVFCLASALQALEGPDPLHVLPHTPPTVVLWGLDDRSYPEHEVDRVLARWPDAAVIPLEDAGHFPGLSHPDVFVEAIRGLSKGSLDVGT